MPQFENIDLFGRFLRSVIGVISRRTSEAYANVVVSNVIEKLKNKYDFLKYVKILTSQYNEVFDVVDIDKDINTIRKQDIGAAASDFIIELIKSMGKNAGYYFIKEVKEDLPTDYELALKDLGLDFDFLQTEFITNIRKLAEEKISNYEILRYTFTVILEVLNKNLGRDATFRILNEFVERLSIQYKVLKYVKIKDIRATHDTDFVKVEQDVDLIDAFDVGACIQKVIQELHMYIEDKYNFSFIEKLKDVLSADYLCKLEEIGVNLEIIRLSQGLIVKQVIKALVDVIAEYSTQSYAILMVNNAIANFYEKFVFVKGIKIDPLKYSGGLEGIELPDNIESIRPSELGRALQRIIENISKSLGEEAGKHFLEKFKKRLGKAYLLRIEELGVNLHMIELKQNLLW